MIKTIIRTVSYLIIMIGNNIGNTQNGFMSLFIKLNEYQTPPYYRPTITWLGVFVIVLPLVGLGIGIIERLIKKR